MVRGLQRARFLLVLLAFCSLNCTRWTELEPPYSPGQVDEPREARIMLNDGRSLELHDPVMEDTRVIGVNADSTVSASYADIDRLEVQELRKDATGLLLFGGVVGAFGLFMLVAAGPMSGAN